MFKISPAEKGIPGESIQGTYQAQKISAVRMYSFISRAGAYACTCTQARKCKKYVKYY